MFSSTTLSLFSFIGALILCFSVAHSSPKIPAKIGGGYRLIAVEETPDGGLVGHLQVKAKNNIYGPDISHLQLYVKHETEERLRVHITDADKRRWEVPYNLLPRESPPGLKKTIARTRKIDPVNTVSEYSSSSLTFTFRPDPFGFAVKRKSDGQVLFNTSSDPSDPFGEMVFKDQYLEISTRLPSDASLYGLGENTQPRGIRLQPNDPYTLYTTDISAINLNADLYGSHPVYMDLRNVGGRAFAHAVLLLNSNGMDVFYRGGSLTYKVIGGVFDFYFFSGPTPLGVVDQYTSFIGRPAPMPYWALGFHQCRWGYHNLSVVEDVVESYKKAEIPLDVIWNDDDHMDGHKDFTLNSKNYPRPKLLAFLEKIHKIGMKYIVIIDPGIGLNTSYGTYTRGLANDVFIKYDGEPFLAQVWPGAVNFPDFLNPKTVDWWVDEIHRFHELVPVDGLWIDMNEASNFCSGKCTIPKGVQCPSGTGPGWICCLDCKNITNTKWDDPPYKINASGTQVPIGFKTIATSATHYNGVLEYDAHSLYGFSQSVATHKGLLSIEGKRPFILSRSTYVGSGKYAAHWTGDNKGTWNDLRYSISTVLNFGIFGVPMVGADICGFYPAPTEELCNRWIEVGAFYPFSRDHANFYSPRQELYQWNSVAKSARNALGMRYKLLPYLYTLNQEAHTSGAPIARPLFFSFPTFQRCYGVSTQFLLGGGVMVSPVLKRGRTSVKALFPPGSWYNLFDMTKAVSTVKGKRVTLAAPLHEINVHVFEGLVLPMQRGGMRSKEARETPYSLVVALGGTRTAKGRLFVDDDEAPEMGLGGPQGKASAVAFYAEVAGDGTVKVWSEVEEGGFALEKGWILEKVSVLGLDGTGPTSGVLVEVDGGTGSAGVEVSSAEQVHVIDDDNADVDDDDNDNDDEDDDGVDDGSEGGVDTNGNFKKSVMVEVKGLSLLIGKKFVLTWKMGGPS